MTEAITAQSVFVVDTMLPGFRWHWHRRRLWFAGTVVCLYGLNLLVAFRNSAGDVSASFWASQIPLLLILATSGIWGRPLERRFCLGMLKHLTAYGKILRWKLTEEGLECHLKHLRSLTPWPEVYESIATEDGVLVYLQKPTFYRLPLVAIPDELRPSPRQGLFHWLPKTAFTADADYHSFIELLKAKTKHSTVG